MDSLWINSIEKENIFKEKTLNKDCKTDVCIVGAGIFRPNMCLLFIKTSVIKLLL